jgi:hypothetical protein
LLHALLADAAVTAEHSQAEVGGLASETGEEGLNRRREQRHQASAAAPGEVGVTVLLVERARNPAASARQPSM